MPNSNLSHADSSLTESKKSARDHEANVDKHLAGQGRKPRARNATVISLTDANTLRLWGLRTTHTVEDIFDEDYFQDLPHHFEVGDRIAVCAEIETDDPKYFDLIVTKIRMSAAGETRADRISARVYVENYPLMRTAGTA